MSNVFDVTITVEIAIEWSPIPESQTPWPGSRSTCRRAVERLSDFSVACGHTSSSQFAQSLSSEPTPSKVGRKTVLQVGVNNVFSSK